MTITLVFLAELLHMTDDFYSSGTDGGPSEKYIRQVWINQNVVHYSLDFPFRTLITRKLKASYALFWSCTAPRCDVMYTLAILGP